MFQLFFILLAVIAASIHLAVSAKRRGSAVAIAETYPIYLLFIYVGLMGLLPPTLMSSAPCKRRRPLDGLPAPTNMKSAWPI